MLMTMTAENARKLLLNEGFRPQQAFVADGAYKAMAIFTAVRGENKVVQLRMRFGSQMERDSWLKDFRRFIKPKEVDDYGSSYTAEDAVFDASAPDGTIPRE